MGLFLKQFSTHAEYDTYINGSGAILPNVSICTTEGDVHYNPVPPHDYSQDYFTMVVTASGNIKWSGTTTANKLSYSKDNGETWTTANSATTISVNVGDKVIWKGAPTPISEKGIGKFSGTTDVRYSVEGNAMSLLFGDNFVNQASLNGKTYALYGLFSGNTNVTSAENMSLPATTLAPYCYSFMFSSCSSLTTALELHATTLADRCYEEMFYDCTSLTTVPTNMLPATTLAPYCYKGMFYGCTSLTTALELHATTLADYCYSFMFSSCSSLTTAPELPATTLAQSCYSYMFYNCTNLTAAPELHATALAIGCYIGMFGGCTSLTATPELLVTTLAPYCYSSMFEGCTSLTTVPTNMLPATTLAQNCYDSMFSGCTSLTAAPELPAATLAVQCYSSMFYNCTSLTSIKCLATYIGASNCTKNWVYNVASNGTFTKAASSGWTTGVNGIPSGWTRVDAA